MQVGAFAGCVQRLIDGGAKAEVQRCFANADHATREGEGNVQNAIGVAFRRETMMGLDLGEVVLEFELAVRGASRVVASPAVGLRRQRHTADRA